MPVADNRRPRKAKKGAEKKAPPPPPPLNVSVRDCMMWPEPKPKGKARVDPESEPHPEVYRSILVRRSRSSDQLDTTGEVPPTELHHQVRKYDGSAIDALRGWPGTRKEEEEACSRYVFDQEERKENVGEVEQKPGKKNNSKKQKGKKAEKNPEDEPVYMTDLIQHRYLNEFAEKRRREMERERRRKEAAEEVRSGRRIAKPKRDVKGTRTSQLRSLSLADRVETSPHDLWKMPRFCRGVEPHLETTTGRGGALRRRGAGDACGPGACFCDSGYRSVNCAAAVSDEELRMGEDAGNAPCDDDAGATEAIN